MSFQFNANTIETPIMMNMYEPNRQQHNNRNTMNCFRRKTNLELHLIFYLILTVILCTIIVVFSIIHSKHSKCDPDHQNKDNFTSTHSTPIVIIEKDRKYVDLNYQPVDTDPHLQAVILKARNSVELLRNALNIPCVGVGVAVNGSTVWAEGVGYSDIENGVKCHRQSAFRLDSISKTLTSILIARLVETSLIDWDSDVSQYVESIGMSAPVPSNSTTGDDRTLTNGTKNETIVVTLRQLMSERVALGPDGRPVPVAAPGGQSWAGIQAILQSITNRSFRSAMNALTNRLHLLSTSADTPDLLVPYRVRYYRHNKGLLENSVGIRGEKDESVVSTVPDVLSFGNQVIGIYEHNSDILTNSSTFKQLIQAQTTLQRDDYYGLGWKLYDSQVSPNASLVFGQWGQTESSSNVFMVRPDTRVVVAVFANLGGVGDHLVSLANMIAKWFLDTQ